MQCAVDFVHELCRIFYMVMSVYIAEVSPKESRGMLGSTIGPTFMAGVTVALLANIGFAKFSIGWRLANVVLGIVGVIYAIGMAFLPYTPRLVVVVIPCIVIIVVECDSHTDVQVMWMAKI